MEFSVQSHYVSTFPLGPGSQGLSLISFAECPDMDVVLFVVFMPDMTTFNEVLYYESKIHLHGTLANGPKSRV